MSNEIIDSIPGVFFVRDRNQFLRWNRQFEIITGYTSGEISKLDPVVTFYDESERKKMQTIKEENDPTTSELFDNMLQEFKLSTAL